MTAATEAGWFPLVQIVPVYTQDPIRFVVKPATARPDGDGHLLVNGHAGALRRYESAGLDYRGWIGDAFPIARDHAGLRLAASQLFPAADAARAVAVIDAHEEKARAEQERRALDATISPAVHEGGPYDGRVFEARGTETGRSYEAFPHHVHTGPGPAPRVYDRYTRTTDTDDQGRVVFRYQGRRT